MKIVIVSTHPTHPAVEGNRRFIYNQVELFKRMGHEVYYVLIFVYKGDWIIDANTVIAKMSEYWGDHLFIFKKNYFFLKKKGLIGRYRNLFNHGYIHCDDYYPSGLDSYINELNGIYHFDCCIANYYILSKLFKYIKVPLKGLVTHDYFSYKNLLTKENKVWLGTTADQEAKALQRCDNIFALNSDEAIYFSNLSPQSMIYTVYSIYEYYPSLVKGNHTLLFLSGNNRYNQNGLEWFFNTIFPEIIKSFPSVKLKIGGAICRSLERLQNNKNIEICGYIDNTLSFYDSGDVVINPTYQGTGLKIKTFEGISYDKAVLAHPHSIKGVFKPDICPIFCSTEAKDWVSVLKRLWGNHSELHDIKKKNKEYLEQMNMFVEKEYLRFFNSMK